MLSMQELVDLRMQQHIAQEIYRQQIMQRIPDPFPAMIPMHMAHHVILPPRPTLPGVEAKLENNDLWQQFHKIGTEMIITKCGRRMFPSQRLSLSGLEEESNYCVLLEMVPIGDCRYKFSGSQWVPAGGAEPQSPQRMYLHPDSPATGAHWQSQPILFSKVKLTNNTLDNNGHVVLASMHKYQPRIHVIRTSDFAQIPWAPQQAFIFPETEFVAVTAYQNDRITKLKIDNNPFAKGFRETGQSRCKRKLTSTTGGVSDDEQQQHADETIVTVGTNNTSKRLTSCSTTEDDRSSVSSFDAVPTQIKRFRSNGSFDDESSFCSSSNDRGSPLRFDDTNNYHPLNWLPSPTQSLQQQTSIHHMHAGIPLDFASPYFRHQSPPSGIHPMFFDPLYSSARLSSAPNQLDTTSLTQDVVSQTNATVPISNSESTSAAAAQSASTKRKNFSISAILAY